MTFDEWCYNNGYTQLDVDVYNFAKEVYNAGIAEGFEQAVSKETKAKEIIRECMGQMAFHDCEYTDAYKKAEVFLKE